jgi:DNA-binding winged helix-turn-helix (wHTH) protein/Tol biopolymer transport system component
LVLFRSSSLMPSSLRFTDLELDLARYELRRSGRVLKLERIPMDLLVFLVEQRGRLVTREEIIDRIWGKDVFVDTETGINTAIRKVRKVLRDDPSRPQLVETVPGKGYRFIAQVTVEDNEEAGAVAEARSRERDAASPARAIPADSPVSDAAVGAEPPFVEGTKTRRRRLQLVVALATSATALLLAYLLRPAMPAPRVTRIVQLTKSGEAFGLEPLFTDGPRVYYVGATGGSVQLKQVLLNGNEDTKVAGVPANLTMLGLSPDDTEFLARIPGDEAGPIWTLPVVGGAPRRIGNFQAHDASWSRDGRLLAYSRDSQIFLALRDGTESHLLVTVPGRVGHIRWSPDDRWLRFHVVSQAGFVSLWEAAADGRHLDELRFHWPGNPMECCGEWTPDGRYFLFQSWREGVKNLWALEEKSDWLRRAIRDPVQLTVGPVNYQDPLPSRDGRKVFAVGLQPLGELLRYDAQRKDFVPFLGGLSADHVHFTRDGQWMAYVMYPEGTLWRARSDGSEQLQLTFPPLRVFQPCWSPDAKQIAFHAKRPGEWSKIYAISRDGGTPEQLLSEPNPQAEAEWLPTGESLGYSRAKNLERWADIAIYRLDLRTGRSEKIPGTDGLFSPHWSPDGIHLAACDAATYQLLLFDLKTGKRTQLSKRQVDYPHWSRDSRYIYFNTLMSTGLALFRVRILDGKEEKITDVRFPITGIYGPPGSELAPDGSPLVLRDRSHSDIYSLSLSLP